jgi:thiosulfate/3-mercaptopyruvate sulfurtransferase
LNTKWIGWLAGLLLLIGQATCVAEGFSDAELLIDLSRFDRLQQSQEKMILLDARAAEAYFAGHLPGSVNYDAALTLNRGTGGLPSLRQVQAQLSRLGLTPEGDKKIVVYDQGDLLDAARIFWILELFGFSGRVAVLEGGVTRWQQEGRALSLENSIMEPVSVILTIDPDRVATKLAVRLAVEDQLTQIVDVRLPANIVALNPDAAPDQAARDEPAHRIGYIPGAVSLPWIELLAADRQQMKSMEELGFLTSLYRNQKIILYCLSGRESALAYLAFRRVGRLVAVYGGGWNEWRQDRVLPIETPLQKPILSGTK